VHKLVIIQEGAAGVHLGNYCQYRWKLSASSTGAPAPESPRARPEDVMKVRRRKGVKGRTKEKEQQRLRRKQTKALEELEHDIVALEETVAAIEAEFGGIDPADHERATELKEQYEGMKRDLAEMYAEWERLADQTATS
jgi:hypothetical protein